MASQLLEKSVTLRHAQLQRRPSGNPGRAGRHAAFLAAVGSNIERESAAERHAKGIQEIPRLATRKLVLSRQFGDPGQAGRHAVNLAMAVKERDRGPATERLALVKRKFRNHATRLNAQQWNHGATGLPATAARENKRELDIAHDPIRDLSVQKNLNSSKAALAPLNHHQNSLHKLQRHKRQRMKLWETSLMTSMTTTRVENACFSTLMETAWITLNSTKAIRLLI